MSDRRSITLDWRAFVGIILLAVTVLATIHFTTSPEFEATAAGGSSGWDTGLVVDPVEGALAPDFALRTLEGEEISLSDFQGRPVLINFWATWCGPCRLEMPAILGEAVEGPLAGSQLERIIAGEHFWFAWAAFRPDTVVWSPEV